MTFTFVGFRHQCTAAAVEALLALLGPGLHHPMGREQLSPTADFPWEVPDLSSSPLKVVPHTNNRSLVSSFECSCL